MNVNLKKILNSSRGRIAWSILLGLGLATLFRKACNNRNCLVFKAPSLSNIKNRVFGYNDKCYEYQEQSTFCENDNKDMGNKLHTPNGNKVTLDVGE